jgi:hypothetical protein
MPSDQESTTDQNNEAATDPAARKQPYNNNYNKNNYRFDKSGDNSNYYTKETVQIKLDAQALVPRNYNPRDFNIAPRSARFFVIKSYSEDDVFRSIKHNVWCSTEHGNRRLNAAFSEKPSPDQPIYLFFSVNGSGHFCGMCEMVSRVDPARTIDLWSQDKWKGCFQVRWIFVKDVPNYALRNVRLENNENKPVTNSRDTQEIPYAKGKEVLKIFHAYKHATCIFDDKDHYEKPTGETAATGNVAEVKVNDRHDSSEKKPASATTGSAETAEGLKSTDQSIVISSNSSPSTTSSVTSSSASSTSSSSADESKEIAEILLKSAGMTAKSVAVV